MCLCRLQDSLSPTVSSPSSSRLVSQIIGAEDDYFDSDQEQVSPPMSTSEGPACHMSGWKNPPWSRWFQTNGQCILFNNIEQLKSRPAHLAAFLHHVISQFDPAPVVSSSASHW